MTDYIIVLFVVIVIISVSISLTIFDVMHKAREIEYKSDKNFIYSQIKRNIEEIDILRAKVWDLEQQLKDRVDDGK